MTHLAPKLRQVRELIAGGWAEPCCLDSSGERCGPLDDSAATFSLAGALMVHGALEAWELLEERVSPATTAAVRYGEALENPTPEELLRWHVMISAGRAELNLRRWLVQPERQLREVLEVIDRTILTLENPT